MFEKIILNCISDAVLTIDLKGNIEYVNKAMQELLGYPEEILIGYVPLKTVSCGGPLQRKRRSQTMRVLL